MVNFKQPRGPNTLTSGMAKRETSGALDGTRYVSECDRVAYDDATGRCASDERFIRLRVLADDEEYSSARYAAYVHETAALSAMKYTAFARRGAALGGACIALEVRPDVPVGCVLMTRAQRHNLRTGIDRPMEFEAVDSVSITNAVDVTVELSLMNEGEEEPRHVTVIESETARRAARVTLGDIGRVLTATEVFVVLVEGREYRARIADVNSLSVEEASSTVGYHCFRARVSPQTTFYVLSSDERKLKIANNEGKARSVRLARREILQVTTRDGETFPVHRSLLRQCIALTSAVRRAGELGDVNDDDHVSVDVDVDTDVFDRVLIFLEAITLGKSAPAYDIRVTEELAVAAQTLGCRVLDEHCAEKLGDHASRIREYDWDEIVAHNAAGGVWLIIDGMVLDVKRWLPEHPGGDVIIPNQSLNMDAARHFEMYHSSRESFLYLKEFYIGEVRAQDRAERVPAPDPAPSDDFVRQLRQYCSFRLESEFSRPHVHLGQLN